MSLPAARRRSVIWYESCKWLCVSANLLCLEKTNSQSCCSNNARLRLRNSTVSVKAETAECLVARDSIIAWCLYKRIETWIIQIYFSDSVRFLCVNAYFGASIHLILFFVSNKTEKSVEFSLRTIKVCRFDIIDGVKYVYCIKHAYKFLLRKQVGFAAVLWRLRQGVS